MSDDTKVTHLKAHLIPGSGEPNAFADGVRNLKKNLALQIEFYQLDAQIRRAHYLALVKEGFTETQALEICKK